MLETQKQMQATDQKLQALGENTDRRIAQLVSAIAKLAERRPNGSH